MGQLSRKAAQGTGVIVPAVVVQRQTHSAPATRRQPALSPMGRWVEVLNAFLRQDDWGVRDLAAATSLPRSAVHRILHEMQRQDLLSAVEVRA